MFVFFLGTRLLHIGGGQVQSILPAVDVTIPDRQAVVGEALVLDVHVRNHPGRAWCPGTACGKSEMEGGGKYLTIGRVFRK